MAQALLPPDGLVPHLLPQQQAHEPRRLAAPQPGHEGERRRAGVRGRASNARAAVLLQGGARDARPAAQRDERGRGAWRPPAHTRCSMYSRSQEVRTRSNASLSVVCVAWCDGQLLEWVARLQPKPDVSPPSFADSPVRRQKQRKSLAACKWRHARCTSACVALQHREHARAFQSPRNVAPHATPRHAASTHRCIARRPQAALQQSVSHAGAFVFAGALQPTALASSTSPSLTAAQQPVRARAAFPRESCGYDASMQPTPRTTM